MSLTVAVVIVLGSWGLLREATRLLFDGVPERVDPLAVRAYLEQLPGVARVDDLHIWAMGTTQIALSAHLIAPGGPLGDAALHRAAEDLRSRFGIQHATLQIMQQPIESLRASHG
jgi:cobalt-zinc-cadmium efflux system protein